MKRISKGCIAFILTAAMLLSAGCRSDTVSSTDSTVSTDYSSEIKDNQDADSTTESTEKESASPESSETDSASSEEPSESIAEGSETESTASGEESAAETERSEESREEQPVTDEIGIMRDITSQQLVDEMVIGWNLGDTLDVCQADRDGDGKVNEHVGEGEKVDETLWGNPMTTQELFENLKECGINSVRIPVTWRDHIDDEGNIDTEWMDRVQQVVDYAYDLGMYVIINVHHDGGGDPKFGAWIIEESQEDYDAFYAKYKNIWTQIAERFKNYSDYLIFESMNEVGFDNLGQAQAYKLINRINQDFVDIIRSTGGNNAERHLLIAGYWTDIERTCDSRYEIPDDPAGRCIVSVHYYTPWDFCTCDIKHTWGTPSEVKQMETLIGKMYSNFTQKGIPVIIGEYAASGSDLQACVFFVEKLNKLCSDYGIATFLWDNGGIVNRTTYEWRIPQYVDALQRAVSGEDYEVVKVDV